MFKLIGLFVVALAALACCEDVDDIINSIFNPPQPIPDIPTETPDLPPGVPEEDNCPIGQNCVQYYHCNNGTLNRDGVGIFDVRFDADTPLECHDYMKICCKNDEVNDELVDRVPREINKGCGLRNPTGLGIDIKLRDTDSKLAEFPWMVAILQKISLNGMETGLYQCGGSLIHPQVVLTAAHCVNKDGVDFIARAGEWDTQTKDEIFDSQDRTVTQIKIHPNYNRGSLHNDIALLYLNEPFILAENVQTICLPPQDYNFNFNRCLASGWGKDTFGKEGRYQVIMKKLELPIVDNGQCQSTLRGTRLGKRFNLHNSFMCAGGERGIDTCSGDGGSPLACPVPGQQDRFYQAGIVAWGIGCGENQVPGVYGNVAKFRHWIDEIFSTNGIDTSFYTNMEHAKI